MFIVRPKTLIIRLLSIVALMAVMLGLLHPLPTADAQTTPGVSDARFARLRHGVNLAFSFWCDQSCINFTRFNSQLPQIAAAGFTHVRMPITFTYIENGSGGVNMTTAAALKTFLDLARASNLAVIVDVHDTSIQDSWNGDYMAKIANATFRTRHINFWRAFATWLNQNTDPEWVFIQPANEPIFWETPSIWYNHQAQLLPAIRAAAPNHTIFVIPHEWQGIEALVWGLQNPVSDRNVIYDIHTYAPLDFTHQCQAFMGTQNICNNPYPGNYQIWNGTTVYYDRARLRSEFLLAVNWANQHNVRLHVSEWGTSSGAPADSRRRYMSDMASIFREFNIGHSVWEWSDNFGIANDTQVIAALTGGQPSQLNGVVRLDGRTNHASPVTIDVFRGSTRLATFNTTTSSSGAFTVMLTGVTPGATRIVVKPQQALASARDIQATGGNLSVDFGSLRLGDVNNDNIVNLSDFSVLASTFNTASGQPTFDPRADLNIDTIVSLPDFSILAANYNATGAPR